MKRYLLFDAACYTCNRLAIDVHRESDGWIDDVLGLRDPKSREMLALGGQGDLRKPVIVERVGNEVKIYKGFGLRWHMFHHLGPAKAWRIARLILTQFTNGSIRSRDEGQAGGNGHASGRRGFIARVGAIAAGIAVATGVSSKSPSYADTIQGDDWLGRLAFGEARPVEGDELTAMWRRFKNSSEVQSMVSAENLAGYADAKSLSEVITQEGGSPDLFYSVLHAVDGNRELEASALQVGRTVVAWYRLSEGAKAKSRVTLLEVDPAVEVIRILAEVEDGEFTLDLQPPGTRPLACNNGCPGTCYVCGCVEIDIACAFNCCAPCTLTCAGGIAVCIACLVAFCPVCAQVNRCCNRRACKWRDSC